jgi:hypothetical protein
VAEGDGEIIQEATLAMRFGLKVADLQQGSGEALVLRHVDEESWTHD